MTAHLLINMAGEVIGVNAQIETEDRPHNTLFSGFSHSTAQLLNHPTILFAMVSQHAAVSPEAPAQGWRLPRPLQLPV